MKCVKIVWEDRWLTCQPVALPSSVMIVLTGIHVGLYDLGAIILIFGINAMMNLFIIMMEYHNQHTEKANWTSFAYGSNAGSIPGIVIEFNFLGPLPREGGNPPANDYAIIFILLGFLDIVPVNMVCSTGRSVHGRITCTASGYISSSAWLARSSWPGSSLLECWRRCHYHEGMPHILILLQPKLG